MPSKNPAVRRAVIDYANACKNPSNEATLRAARANLAVAQIADFIVRTLAESPPLSQAQRVQLTRLLKSA